MLVLESTSNHLIIFRNATRKAFVLDKVGAAPIAVAVRVRYLFIVYKSFEN